MISLTLINSKMFHQTKNNYRCLKTYRISRIQQAEPLDDTFSRPEGFELAAYWEQSTLDFKANICRNTQR
jgi:hypothetical protein